MNLLVYKGNWVPSGQGLLTRNLQEEAVSASSTLCDAEVVGRRVPAVSTQWCILTTPRAAAPSFSQEGMGRGAHATVKLQFQKVVVVFLS